MKPQRLRSSPVALLRRAGGLAGVLTVIAAAGAAAAPEDGTVRSKFALFDELPPEAVRWTNGFWADRFELCRREMLPAVEAALLDPRNAEQLGNLRVAAGLEAGRYRGTDWSDGDCYKWIEAMAYVFAVTRDPALDRKMDEWIGVIARAQAPDGYLSTNIQLDPSKRRWADVRHHALYNMGHLITAACAHQRATGKDSFLAVARRVADHLHTVFAPRPPELARMDFNPSQMMALVDLYRLTGERRYLELADLFVTMRGSAPATAEQGRDRRHLGGTDQTQDRVPLREETQAVGHAVTAGYLWCGAADVQLETGEPALRRALERVWRSATLRRTYITGGACALSAGRSTRGDEVHEAFGADFELPPRTAYNETCANIGQAMWNWRMLRITGEAKYADAMETVLHNSLLSAVGADGRSFFYANPLAWSAPTNWPTKHYTQTRWFVHACYCCPPQVARTVAGLGRWACGVSDGAVWVHLYGGGTLRARLPGGDEVVLEQQTDYPWDGRIRLRFAQPPPAACALKLRIPGWAGGAALKVNGTPVAEAVVPGSYATLRRVWTADDVVELDLPMRVRLMEAHPSVEACRGRVAVMRGPVVYCREAPDTPGGARAWDATTVLPPDVRFTPRREPGLAGGVTVLTAVVPVGADPAEPSAAPAAAVEPGAEWADRLYREYAQPPSKPYACATAELTLIPYFAWANRGPSRMEVWMAMKEKRP